MPASDNPVYPLQVTGAQKQELEQKKLEKTAKELEGVFVSMVLKQMQATVPKDELFNNDTTQMFTEMLNDEFGKLIAKGHSMGLANAIMRAVQKK